MVFMRQVTKAQGSAGKGRVLCYKKKNAGAISAVFQASLRVSR